MHRLGCHVRKACGRRWDCPSDYPEAWRSTLCQNERSTVHDGRTHCNCFITLYMPILIDINVRTDVRFIQPSVWAMRQHPQHQIHLRRQFRRRVGSPECPGKYCRHWHRCWRFNSDSGQSMRHLWSVSNFWPAST